MYSIDDIADGNGTLRTGWFGKDNSLLEYKNGTHVLVKQVCKDVVIKDFGETFDEIFYDGYANGCGLVDVKKNSLWGLIDKEGETVLPPMYANISIYKIERELVVFLVREAGASDSEMGLHKIVDVHNKDIVPTVYDRIDFACYGRVRDRLLFFVQKDGKCGMIDHAGIIIIPIKYDLLDTLGACSIYGENDVDNDRFDLDGSPHIKS